MPAVLLDTDVVSFQIKGDTRARQYDAYLRGKIPVISFMTLAELEFWAVQNRWGEARKDHLRRHLSRFVIVPTDSILCRLWAEVRDQSRKNGRTIGFADGWIAATALHQGVPLVTNNPRDYAGVTDVTILSAVGGAK